MFYISCTIEHIFTSPFSVSVINPTEKWFVFSNSETNNFYRPPGNRIPNFSFTPQRIPYSWAYTTRTVLHFVQVPLPVSLHTQFYGVNVNATSTKKVPSTVHTISQVFSIHHSLSKSSTIGTIDNNTYSSPEHTRPSLNNS